MVLRLEELVGDAIYRLKDPGLLSLRASFNKPELNLSCYGPRNCSHANIGEFCLHQTVSAAQDSEK